MGSAASCFPLHHLGFLVINADCSLYIYGPGMLVEFAVCYIAGVL